MFPEPRFIKTNGIRLAVYEAGPIEGTPVLFLHGFPEMAYSWRHQLPALAEAGYRAIAVDLRGFGRSDAPGDVEAYCLSEIAGDVAGLLDALEVERGIICGHDWGSLVVWSLPFYLPNRLRGLISLNLPYLPRRGERPMRMLEEKYGSDHYICYFQKPGQAEALFEADVTRTFRFFMRSGEALDAPGRALHLAFEQPEDAWGSPTFLSSEEIAVYAEAYRNSGFKGALNWYRNIDANWRDMEQFEGAGTPAGFDLPILMIMAGNDPMLPPVLAEEMKGICPQAQVEVVEGSGHWTQQEKPDEVNRLLLSWLDRNFGVDGGEGA